MIQRETGQFQPHTYRSFITLNSKELIDLMPTNSYSKRRYTVMRQEIVEAARQIMQQDGVDGLSMRSIASRVKTSPANLYEYFLNKEEIVFSVYNEILYRLYTHLHQLDTTDDARTDLFNLSMAYVDFIIQDLSRIQIVSYALQTDKLIQKQYDIPDDLQNNGQSEAHSVSINSVSVNKADGWHAQHNEQAWEKRLINPPDILPANATTDLYRENIERIYILFLNAIERCLAEGILQNTSQMSTKDIAHVFWAFTHGLVTLSLQDVSTINAGVVRTALETFLLGLSQRHCASNA